MNPSRQPQEQNKVFILGFSGTEIYYSATERRIYSSFSTAPTKEVVGEKDDFMGGDGSSFDAK